MATLLSFQVDVDHRDNHPRHYLRGVSGWLSESFDPAALGEVFCQTSLPGGISVYPGL